jgi:hypothetical protein
MSCGLFQFPFAENTDALGSQVVLIQIVHRCALQIVLLQPTLNRMHALKSGSYGRSALRMLLLGACLLGWLYVPVLVHAHNCTEPPAENPEYDLTDATGSELPAGIFPCSTIDWQIGLKQGQYCAAGCAANFQGPSFLYYCVDGNMTLESTPYCAQLIEGFQPCIRYESCHNPEAGDNPLVQYINPGNCIAFSQTEWIVVSSDSCIDGVTPRYWSFSDPSCDTLVGSEPTTLVHGECLSGAPDTVATNATRGFVFECGNTEESCMTPAGFVFPGIRSKFIPPLNPGILFVIITVGAFVIIGLIYWKWWKNEPELLPKDCKVIEEESVAKPPPMEVEGGRKSGNILHHIGRGLGSDFVNIRRFENEPEVFSTPTEINRYTLWRHSAFKWYCIIQVVVIALAIVNLVHVDQPAREASLQRQDGFLRPAYVKLNQVLLAFDVIRIVVYAICWVAILSCIYRWSSFKYTSRVVSFCWLLQLIFPFVLQLFPCQSHNECRTC